MKIDVRGIIVPNDDKWIYDYFDIESTCPKDVAAALDKAAGMPVEVDINSGGGDIFAGSEIYTLLRAYSHGVTIRVVGLAASAASVIAMAGRSEISPTAMVMVHNVSSMAWGDYHAMDHQSDVLQRANKAIAAAYIAKSGMTEKEVLVMMDGETWLTAQQAVEKKLIDRIMFSDTRMVASYGSKMLPQEVIEKMRNSRTAQPQGTVSADFIKAKQNQLNLKARV